MLLTNQQVFDKVSTHLLKQNKRSATLTGRCVYREGETGLMCAAGCLIPDDLYSSRMEDQTVVGEHAAPVFSQIVQDLEFLESLQRIHDEADPKQWRELLGHLGTKHQLNLDCLKEKDCAANQTASV